MNEVRCTPNIRFPGFNSDWRKCKLSDVLEVVTKRNGTKYTKCDVLSVSDEYGCVNQIRFQGRSFAGDDISNYKIVQTGDIVYTRSPLQAKPFGIIKLVTNETGIDELSIISLSEIPTDDYLLQDGDIVFVRSNGNKSLVGRCVVVYPGQTKVTFSGFCIRLRLENSIIQNDFLLNVLKTEPMRKAMQGRGSDIHNLNQAILDDLDIPIPCIEEQHLIADFLSDFDEAVSAAKKELKLWKELKKGLLQQMFV